MNHLVALFMIAKSRKYPNVYQLMSKQNVVQSNNAILFSHEKE